MSKCFIPSKNGQSQKLLWSDSNSLMSLSLLILGWHMCTHTHLLHIVLVGLSLSRCSLQPLLPAGLDGLWLSQIESLRIYRPISPLKHEDECKLSARRSATQADHLLMTNYWKTLYTLKEKWSSHKGQEPDRCSFLMKLTLDPTWLSIT